MTGDAIGPLGRRFLVAFVLVSLLTVALVAAAGLVGSDRGLASQDDARRQAVADRTADQRLAQHAVEEPDAAVGKFLRTLVTAARQRRTKSHDEADHHPQRGDIVQSRPERAVRPDRHIRERQPRKNGQRHDHVAEQH